MTASSELRSVRPHLTRAAGEAPTSAPSPARIELARAACQRTGWALGAGLMLVVAGLGLHASTLDRSLFLAINAWQGLPAAIPSALSVAGLGVSVFVGVCAWSRRPAGLLASLLLAFVLGTVLVHGLKYGLRWPRPLAVLTPGEVHHIGLHVTGRAMPSGHATSAFALWALLVGNVPGAWVVRIGAGLFAVGVAWARMAVGAHWPGDVLVGAGLGLWVGIAALALARHWRLARRWDRPAPRMLLRAALLACAVYLVAVPTGYPAADPLPWVLAGTAAWSALQARSPHP